MFPRDITAQDFLQHTAPAVQELFIAIEKEVARYRLIQASLQQAQHSHYFDFTTADLSEDFDDIQVQFKFSQSSEAKMQSLLISQSIEVLCGAVFQIAKQGISLILKGSKQHRKGRNIGSQPLSNIIWHARNQAMHWEDGRTTNKNTKKCFQTLVEEFGNHFSFDLPPRNMSWDVFMLLEWNTFADYEKDLGEILDE